MKTNQEIIAELTAKVESFEAANQTLVKNNAILSLELEKMEANHERQKNIIKAKIDEISRLKADLSNEYDRHCKYSEVVSKFKTITTIQGMVLTSPEVTEEYEDMSKDPKHDISYFFNELAASYCKNLEAQDV